MFEEFKQEVLAAYLAMRDGHALPNELEQLTRSNLRRHALWIIAHRYERKDDEVIQRFFDPENRYTNHEERIRQFSLDGFRSLISFLNNKERKRTDDWNIKILAWLIDFEPRPYAEWRKMRHGERGAMNDNGADTKGNQEAGIEIGGDTSKPEGPTARPAPAPAPPTQPLKKSKLTWYLVGAVLLAGLTTYFVISRPECLDKQCMYWFNDRYVTVCCGKQLPGVTFVALNPHELEHFRKITRTDTLTAAHANKVWYSKIDNNVEFFTAPATRHPVHHDKLIKPATAYILEKYAGK